jgi:hypothetical protein
MDMASLRNLLLFPSHCATGLLWVPLILPEHAYELGMFLLDAIDRALGADR